MVAQQSIVSAVQQHFKSHKKNRVAKSQSQQGQSSTKSSQKVGQQKSHKGGKDKQFDTINLAQTSMLLSSILTVASIILRVAESATKTLSLSSPSSLRTN
jgi:hypothetical protein